MNIRKKIISILLIISITFNLFIPIMSNAYVANSNININLNEQVIDENGNDVTLLVEGSKLYVNLDLTISNNEELSQFFGQLSYDPETLELNEEDENCFYSDCGWNVDNTVYLEDGNLIINASRNRKKNTSGILITLAFDVIKTIATTTIEIKGSEDNQYLLNCGNDNGNVWIEPTSLKIGTGNSETIIYKIIYNPNTTDEINDNPTNGYVIENEEYQITNEKPSRTGYRFMEWNTLEDGNGTSYTEGDTIAVTNDIILYAKWKREYVISVSNDEQQESIALLEGEKYTIPENPSKEGYRFIGWNSKEDGTGTTYTAGDKITVSEDIEIHAIWKKEHSISVSNDGQQESLILLEGEEYTIPETPSKEGYRFIEWNTEEDGTGITYTAGDKVAVSEDITIYAIWKKECTVTYGSEGTTEILLEGDEFTLPEVEEQEGYRFIEWNTAEDGTGTSYQVGDKIILSDDINLYEIWKEEFFVTYHAEETTMEIALEGENYKISSTIPTKEGYKFIEWNTEEDGTGTTYLPEQEIILEDNLDLYAQMKEFYTIKYNSNIDDEVNNLPEQEEIFKGEEYTISNKVPERTGYRFMGWNTQPDGTGENYSSEQNVTLESSIELFAIWKKEYVITINEDNNDENPTTIVILEGEEYTIPTVTTREGYRFMGWNTQADGKGTTYQEGESVTLQDNFKIYQIWKKEFTISYNAGDDVTNIATTENVLENEKYTISNTIPAREGFMFTGWNTEEDGTGIKYIPGETKVIKENLNIYAQWKENTYDEQSEKLYLSTGIYKIGDNNINNYENGDLYITKIQAETKLTDYIKQLYTNGNIAVYNTEGTLLTEDDIIATGMKLVVTKDEEKIELTIAVIGDLDSNGKITITDLSEMNKTLIDVKSLEGEYKLAADFDDNNKITVTDLSMINKELLK